MFMQQLGFSLTTMVLGLLIVFTGLVILIGAIKVLSLVVGKAAGAKAPKAAPAPIAAPAPEPEPAVEAVDPASDPQLIAVITAAIMACEGTTQRLAVRSVRRIGGGWTSAARAESFHY